MKSSKKIYSLLYIIYSILSIIVFISYLNFNSTKFGLIYNIINLFILFIFTSIILNYNNKNIKIRKSKTIIIFILGIFNSFILRYLLNGSNYIDESLLYLNKNFISICILKPIIYSITVILSFLEHKIFKTDL